MATTILASVHGQSLSAGSTNYFLVPTSRLTSDTTQARRECIFREAGNIQNLYAKVTANSATASSNITVLKNGVATALDYTLTAGETGIKQDNSVVAVAAGDKLVYRVTVGTGGTITIQILSIEFDATTNTVCRHGTANNSVSATTAVYFGLSGINSAGDATENNVKIKMQQSGTFKNLYTRVISNSKAATSTVTFRKNGAATSMACSIGSSATGDFEDTADTVSVVSGDDVDIELLGTASGSISTMFSVGFETTDGKGFLSGSSNSTSLTMSEPLTRYMAPYGKVELAGSTESDAQLTLSNNYTFSKLTIHVSANTINATTPFRFRKNTADGNLVANITSSGTGYFTDTSNIDSLATNDVFNCNIITSDVSGTQSMTVQSYLVVFAATTNMSEVAAKTYANKFITKV